MANTKPQPRPTLGGLPSGTYRRLLVRPVVEHPHPALIRISSEIDPRDARALALAEMLVATMRASPDCFGLSAPQLGENVRMVAVNVTGHEQAQSCSGLIVLVNPRVLAHAGLCVMRENCASVPFLIGDVARPSEVVVTGFEPGTGRSVVLSANGVEARCLQHEIDHLDGCLFIDRARTRGGMLRPRRYPS